MKMGFLFSGLFWGIIIVLIGVSIIVKVMFKVNIPIVRIVLGLIVVYFGLRILFGGSCSKKNDTIFGERTFSAVKVQKKYTTVFGSSFIDLSGIVLEKDMHKIDLDTVFGSTVVKLAPEAPVKIVVNAVFSGAQLPDGSQTSFGEQTYESKQFKDAKKKLLIKADVVFGSLEFK